MDDFIDDSMTDMYIYEVSQMLPQIEQILIEGDRDKSLRAENIHILFRLMHTLKSSSRAMGYKVCSNLAHKVEDLFKYLEKTESKIDDFSEVSDIALACIDYFKLHVVKIKNQETEEDDTDYLIERIDNYFKKLETIEIENTLDEKSEIALVSPKTSLSKTPYEEENLIQNPINEDEKQAKTNIKKKTKIYQSSADPFISVRMDKLDDLINLVGEIVIAEPLVTESKEIKINKLIKFQRDSSRLHKMVTELQSLVMSIRMVSLASTMVKMHRVLHDMNKKFISNVELIVIGEDTEVDKNVIDKIADPLMHIIRNSIDHGIETKEERLKLNKTPNGKITLEAKNIGSNVLISVSDDGRGLDSILIYEKATRLALIDKPFESMSKEEIFQIILLPGFSTNNEVSEFSGRGFGMDIVKKNVESLGGSIHIFSKKNEGTTITLKIPLLLSIIEGMNIRINKTLFTVPIVNVIETFRATKEIFVSGPKDEKLIKVRDNLYPMIGLNKVFNLEYSNVNYDRGLILVLETEGVYFCIYADQIIGQYPVVAKAIPDYLQKYKEIDGISGCTIMRDGTISLILDCYAIIKLMTKTK